MKFCPGGTVKLADEFIILVSFEMPSGYRKTTTRVISIQSIGTQ
jgi:hypothetical protein